MIEAKIHWVRGDYEDSVTLTGDDEEDIRRLAEPYTRDADHFWSSTVIDVEN